MSEIFLFFLVKFTFAEKSPDPDCVDWFNRSKIQPKSKDCELRCGAIMTDMATFICPNQCEELCKISENSNPLGKFLYYPGLTPAEKKLIEKYPTDILNVFTQKTRAEWSSRRNFPDQNMNDESDAFRHFIWAGLLTKEFLDAHEDDPDQPMSERNMDLHNNNRGQYAAQELIKKKLGACKNLRREG